jgi:hypothetical protein
MAATRVHNYAEVIVNRAERDLRQAGRVSQGTSDLLALLNVSRLVCIGSFANGCPRAFSGTGHEGPLGDVVKIPDATPVLFSRRLIQLAPPGGKDKPVLWDPIFASEPMAPRLAEISRFLDRYREIAGLDMANRSAAALPVRALPADASPPANDGEDWHPQLSAYEVSLQDVDMTILSDADGYVQISHPWYPATEVRINGQRIAPLQGAIDLMVLPITKGRNVIRLSPRTTTVTRVAVGLSGTGVVLALGITGFLATRRQRSGPT